MLVLSACVSGNDTCDGELRPGQVSTAYSEREYHKIKSDLLTASSRQCLDIATKKVRQDFRYTLQLQLSKNDSMRPQQICETLTQFEYPNKWYFTFAVKWKPWTSEVCKTMEVLKTVVDRLRYLLRRVEYKLVSVSATWDVRERVLTHCWPAEAVMGIAQLVKEHSYVCKMFTPIMQEKITLSWYVTGVRHANTCYWKWQDMT